MSTLPNFLQTRGLSGDPGLPSIAPAPAAYTPPPASVAAPVEAPATAPPSKSHQFADALRQALPIILATIARNQGGPLAGAGLLEGYTAATERQRQIDQHQHELDLAQAERDDVRAQKDAERAQAQVGALQNFIDHQATTMRADPNSGDPTWWAAAVKRASVVAQRAFGAKPGDVESHPALQFSDAASAGKAQKDAQAKLDRAQKNYSPEQWGKILETPDQFAIDGTALSDLLAAAGSTLTQDGKAVAVTPATPKPGAENEDATIKTEIAIAQKKKGAPLTDEETQQARERGRQRWALAGQAAAIGDLSVSDAALKFVSEMALSGVNVQTVVPSFSGRAGAQAKASFIEDLAKRASTLGLTGHDLAAIMTDSKAKQAAYTNAQKLGTQTVINEANAKKNFTQLIGLADKLDAKSFNTAVPILNDWIRTGVLATTGDQDVNNFLGILKETLTEYAKVVSGQTTGAGVTQHANELAQGLIKRGMNAGAIRSFRGEAEKAMKNRVSSYDEALKGIFGNIRAAGTGAGGGGLGSGLDDPPPVPDVPPAIAAALKGQPKGRWEAPVGSGQFWDVLADGTVKKVIK